VRIIATCDNDDLGLIEENEVLDSEGNPLSEKTMLVLVYLKMAKEYDDTKPIVGKSVNKYEDKQYPIGRQVFFNDSIYISIDKTTRAPLLESEITPENPDLEWEIFVTGAKAV